MNIRAYEDSDYETIQDWWEGHEGCAPDPNLLSDDGLIIDNVAASWLYLGNSCIAFVGWCVANPEIGKLTAMKGLEAILREQAKLAKVQGCLVVFAYTSNPGLLKLMDRVGFRKGDELVTNMILGV